MKQETILRTKIKELLKEKEMYVITLHGSPMQQAGLPDLMFIYDGYAYFFEIKMPGLMPTKLQELVHERIRRTGAEVYVIDSIEKAEKIIKRIESIHLVDDFVMA